MKSHDSFTRSSLGRSKPRKHFFRSIVNSTLKRSKVQHSHIGLVEDSTSSTTIVRIIIGLLMVHLVIIGGVLLKGHFDKLAGGVAVLPTVTPPPPPAVQDDVLPQPTAPAVAVAPAQGNHITQAAQADTSAQASANAPELFPEEGAAAVPAPAPAASTPVVVAPAPAAPVAPAQPDAAMVTLRHLVNSGDTWYGIAQSHGISMDALKAANPAAARKNHLYPGIYLNVPVKADSAAAQNAAAQAPAEEVSPVYTVKRGDTLARIARKHKMSTAALMKLNDLTEKDARHIKIGQKLKVSK